MSDLKTTRWSSQVTPDNVWREYPRPAFARRGWKNLNGLWEYAFTKEEQVPSRFEGQILVPFSPEAPLSGVSRQLLPEELLWYRTSFFLEREEVSGGRRLFLHFGAVDQTCTVYLNGVKVGSHIGGYLPFTMDITEFCTDGEQQLLVQVRDISDTGWHSRGKQKLKSGGMFYTAQSGIWQTVWLESVPEHFFLDVRIRPDYDKSLVKLRLSANTREKAVLTVFEDFTDDMLQCFLETGKVPGTGRFSMAADTGRECEIPMEGFQSWSPESPKLYGLLIEGKEDTVLSYFAMRKCRVEKDGSGISRLYLNNRPYFQTGLLDQGYWPDGLYTAPCDEALVFDIETAKSMGFNLLRKHVKVEAERWYYHCDRLGMLVWQDMVNGGSTYRSWFVTYLATAASCLHIPVKDSHRRLLSRREKEGRRQFLRELRDMVKTLYNHPSIVCWVPFNEGWGQFDGTAVTEYLRSLDGTRLIDQASGWFDQGGGDIESIHSYFFPYTFRKGIRAAALTEYGGYCLPVEGHRHAKKSYGYRRFLTANAFSLAVGKLIKKAVQGRIGQGLSAAVYTQLSDVEEEVNGLLTYDREILKISAEQVKAWNGQLKETVNQKEIRKGPILSKPKGATAVIGGADGPTSVFLAGKKGSFRKKQVSWKRKHSAEEIIPNGHTIEELKEYLKETYGAEPVSETSEDFGFFYRAMKSNLVLQERQDLLKTPEPECPVSSRKKFRPEDKKAIQAYTAALERRFKEAEEVPDEMIPMIFSVYRFPIMEQGRQVGDVTVELEDIRQKVGISYSTTEDREEPIKISKDIIRYFGVRPEDIEAQTERLMTYLYMNKEI
ncbi:MAG: glycoside hydrolase family 2 [Lachnospiraceae bacterium]|nr:glycoside hydrolase family 2 [Lachnospiraceae bacterium]